MKFSCTRSTLLKMQKGLNLRSQPVTSEKCGYTANQIANNCKSKSSPRKLACIRAKIIIRNERSNGILEELDRR